MKYDKDTPLGLDWAGYVDVRRAYDWDPGSTWRVFLTPRFGG